MTKQSIIPTKHAKCKIPVCSACIGSMMSKQNWRTKPWTDYKLLEHLKPSNLISVNMLVLPIPGLIAQMISFLTTRKRYKYATIYVSNWLCLGYIYLQTDVLVETTLKGKQAFE